MEGAYTGLGGPVSIVADPGRFTSCFGEFGTVRLASLLGTASSL